jgi:acyl-CoA dehydrogenase
MRTTAAPETPASLSALRGEVRTLIREWRDAGRFTPRADAWLRGYDRAFTLALAERGWIGLTWPSALGGGGRSNLARLVVTEELLRAGAPVAAHWIADRQIGPAILRSGTRELQEEMLPRIAAGEATFCLCMSETEAGSDLAAVRTKATRADGGWLLDGAKIWTSQAHRSEYAYVLVRTSADGEKHEGLTELIADMSAEGVTVRPIVDLQGEHHFNEVLFSDVFVPDRWVIGEVGGGWRQVTEQLAFERGGPERVLSTYPLFEALLDALRSGGDRADLVVVGDLAARAMALRQMVWDVALAMDRGEAPIREAAMLKQLGTAFEQDVAEQARHVLGVVPRPPGPEPADLLGDALLASPGFTIRGGTSEVLLGIIARSELAR